MLVHSNESEDTVSTKPTTMEEWEVHAHHDIKKHWPDKRIVCLGLANLIDSHRRSDGPSMPLLDYNHMFVLLGHDVAKARSPKQCAAAFTKALIRSGFPLNS